MHLHIFLLFGIVMLAMLKLSILDIFHDSIDNPSTDIEHTNKARRYEWFFGIIYWDEYLKKRPKWNS